MAWWFAAISVGTQLLGSMSNAQGQKGAEKAQKRVDRANADAANAVRGASNKFAAARASLSNLTRSLDNRGKLQAGGDALDALATNFVRAQDQAVTGSLNQRISAAEQMGALRAAAAASGAGGTSAAMLQQTLQLAQARAETSRSQNREYQSYDMLAQRAGLVGNMVMSLDQGQNFAPIDYGINLAPFRAGTANDAGFMDFMSGGGGAALGQGLGSLFGGGAKAATGVTAGTAPVAQVFPIDTGSVRAVGYI